ncbi:MAG: hypothetical protein VKJ04_00430 [Vampirovibrionales bacterium]|nr:hypothetical protein [Vampirovibrionales bacterium]
MSVKHFSKRKAYPGSTLIVTFMVLSLLIGFLGIAAFIGIQSYVQGELQKAANASVLVGAAAMYQSTGSNLPSANQARAIQATMDTANAIVSSSSFQNFNIRVVSGPIIDPADNSVRLDLAGEIPTPFLALAGITSIEVNAQAKAQPLQLKPTELENQGVAVDTTGFPTIDPDSAFQRTVTNFPILDRTGNDIYIDQGDTQQGYQIEACTATDCYNLGPAAVTVGGGTPWPNMANKNIVRGSVLIDMARANVKKASSIKISDDGSYYTIEADGTRVIDANNNTLTLDISVLGHAGLCPADQPCTSTPMGYSKY